MSKSVEQEGGAKKKRSVKAKGKSKSKTAKTTKTTKHKTSKSKSKTSKSKGKKGGAKKRYFKMIDPSSGSTIVDIRVILLNRPLLKDIPK